MINCSNLKNQTMNALFACHTIAVQLNSLSGTIIYTRTAYLWKHRARRKRLLAFAVVVWPVGVCRLLLLSLYCFAFLFRSRFGWWNQWVDLQLRNSYCIYPRSILLNTHFLETFGCEAFRNKYSLASWNYSKPCGYTGSWDIRPWPQSSSWPPK